jgi:hypothetical protein
MAFSFLQNVDNGSAMKFYCRQMIARGVPVTR